MKKFKNHEDFIRLFCFSILPAELRKNFELFDIPQKKLQPLKDLILQANKNDNESWIEITSVQNLYQYEYYLPAPKGVASRVQLHPIWIFETA